MGEVLAVRKGFTTCSRIRKTRTIGASCAGTDSCEMTLNEWAKSCRSSLTMLRSMAFILSKM